MAGQSRKPIEIGLNAAIVAVEGDTPLILAVRQKEGGGRDSLGLPFGPFDPLAHRTLDMGLRAWVEEQTALRLGYVEQLYTFGDRGRHALPGDVGPHVVSVGYLALTRVAPEANAALERAGAEWRNWYEFFPWEDWRDGRPAILDDVIIPALRRFVQSPPPGPPRSSGPGLAERMHLAFGDDGGTWDEERVLERYELLYSAALVTEARRDGRVSVHGVPPVPGIAMRFDHRRILATAISRLRGKLKYRPLVFELMPKEFTLTELQRTVEAISGRHLHKQNFRRLVEASALVESTGATTQRTGGRPAALFRFRRDVIRERPAPGLRFGVRT
jgi:hypothetical protein